MTIIDGKSLADNILLQLANDVKNIKAKYRKTPELAIIIVGDNHASQIYVKNKLLAAKAIGLNAFRVELSETITTKTLLEKIKKLNNNPNVSAIIIQLPLPSHVDKNLVLEAIYPEKDVDGFHPLNVGCLYNGIKKGFAPGTALGCLELIKTHMPDLLGKHAVIIGRSQIVGRPVAALLLEENCTVTICHSNTKNLAAITVQADIVVSAVGKTAFLTEKYFKSDSIVIDVGINRSMDSNKITGDVDFNGVYGKVKYISPVPGGVGPLTVAFLLKNTIKAFLLQNKL